MTTDKAATVNGDVDTSETREWLESLDGVLQNEGADRAGQTANLTVSIPTGMGEVRNALIARAVDALIAISGEYGTLSEIALALKTGKRVVALGSWEIDGVVAAASPAEAARVALQAAEQAEQNRDAPPGALPTGRA